MSLKIGTFLRHNVSYPCILFGISLLNIRQLSLSEYLPIHFSFSFSRYVFKNWDIPEAQRFLSMYPLQLSQLKSRTSRISTYSKLLFTFYFLPTPFTSEHMFNATRDIE